MALRDLPWRPIAWLVTRPAVRAWLIRRAQRTPYTHITRPDDPNDVYMGRWWLFNAYGPGVPPRWPWLPSIRVHHICRPDSAAHEHDHPWHARTVILQGAYRETRSGVGHWMTPGRTARLRYGEYHTITDVSVGGVWTLFFTWRYRGTWGFLVDGVKVPYREYLKAPPP